MAHSTGKRRWLHVIHYSRNIGGTRDDHPGMDTHVLDHPDPDDDHPEPWQPLDLATALLQALAAQQERPDPTEWAA
jgi:hypothetical protein